MDFRNSCAHVDTYSICLTTNSPLSSKLLPLCRALLDDKNPDNERSVYLGTRHLKSHLANRRETLPTDSLLWIISNEVARLRLTNRYTWYSNNKYNIMRSTVILQTSSVESTFLKTELSRSRFHDEYFPISITTFPPTPPRTFYPSTTNVPQTVNKRQINGNFQVGKHSRPCWTTCTRVAWRWHWKMCTACCWPRICCTCQVRWSNAGPRCSG